MPMLIPLATSAAERTFSTLLPGVPNGISIA